VGTSVTRIYLIISFQVLVTQVRVMQVSETCSIAPCMVAGVFCYYGTKVLYRGEDRSSVGQLDEADAGDLNAAAGTDITRTVTERGATRLPHLSCCSNHQVHMNAHFIQLT
jgi:hypothetical protein